MEPVGLDSSSSQYLDAGSRSRPVLLSTLMTEPKLTMGSFRIVNGIGWHQRNATGDFSSIVQRAVAFCDPF